MNTTTSVQTIDQAIDEQAQKEKTAKPEAGVFLKIMAIAIPLLSFAVLNSVTITSLLLTGTLHLVQISYMVGSLIGTFLIPLIVMLLFQIGKRFRNSRSCWTVFMYAGLVMFFLNILSAVLKALSA